MEKQPHRRRAFVFLASATLLAYNGAVVADPHSDFERPGHMTGPVSIAPVDKMDWVDAAINPPLTKGDRPRSDTPARTVTPLLGTGGSVIVSVPTQTIPTFGSYGAMSGGTANGAWAKVIIAPVWTTNSTPLHRPASDLSCEYCSDGIAGATAASFAPPATHRFGDGSRGPTVQAAAGMWQIERAGPIPASYSARKYGPAIIADHGVIRGDPERFVSDARGSAPRFEANSPQDGGTGPLYGTAGYGSGGEAVPSAGLSASGSYVVLEDAYQAGAAHFGPPMDGPAVVIDGPVTQTCCVGLYDGIGTDFSDVSRWDAGLVSESIVPVPEPGTLALLGVGLIGLGLTRRKVY